MAQKLKNSTYCLYVFHVIKYIMLFVGKGVFMIKKLYQGISYGGYSPENQKLRPKQQEKPADPAMPEATVELVAPATEPATEAAPEVTEEVENTTQEEPVVAPAAEVATPDDTVASDIAEVGESAEEITQEEPLAEEAPIIDLAHEIDEKPTEQPIAPQVDEKPVEQPVVSQPEEESEEPAPQPETTASQPEIKKMLDGQDLLAQIDSFRDKALQLQALIAGKEGRVAALKKMVDSQEKQLKELQDELSVKQREADELSGNFEKHIQSLTAELRADMNSMQGKIADTLAEGNESIKEQIVQNQSEMADDIASVKESVESIQTGFDGLETRLGDKIHSEDVTVYRNIADLAKEYDTRETLNELTQAQQGNIDRLEKKTRRLTIFAIVQTILVVLALIAVVLL